MRDQRGRAIIKSRIDRVALGTLGDSRSVGGGVSELRVDFGPGYRVYFGKEGEDVILLWGGGKQSQAKDITRAKIYWTEYQSRA